uniref:hypothetical protein n=1 Tax=Nocardia donostiensis TaxID=1538463 RepID=UPI00159309B5|nr:hypothetical protein [Nocardia donostiensis]
MIANATPEQTNRWHMQKCGDHGSPENLEHARYLLSTHAGHGGCRRYLDGLAYTAAMM